jgi:hypothetical protein
MPNAAPAHHTPREIEEARWEMSRENCPRGLQPGNPYREGNEYGKAGAKFPMMLLKANQIPPGLPNAGKYRTSCEEPKRFGFRDEDEWIAAKQAALDFTTGCQVIVHDEDQLLLRKGQGYRESAKAAEEIAEGARIDRGNEAHARNQGERNMSERALRERDAAEQEHFGHLPVIEQKPITRRVKKEKSGKSASA